MRAVLSERLRAKRDRDFPTADRLRQQLQAEGVELFDKSEGGVGITTASGGPLARSITVAQEPQGSVAPPA